MILLLQSLLISPNGGMEGDIGPKGQDNHLKLSRDVSIERSHLDHLRQVPHVTEEGTGLLHSHSKAAGTLSHLWLQGECSLSPPLPSFRGKVRSHERGSGFEKASSTEMERREGFLV